MLPPLIIQFCLTQFSFLQICTLFMLYFALQLYYRTNSKILIRFKFEKKRGEIFHKGGNLNGNGHIKEIS